MCALHETEAALAGHGLPFILVLAVLVRIHLTLLTDIEELVSYSLG